jgi:deazaflavin-dependent oxidoreductase (nitroreductase family)
MPQRADFADGRDYNKAVAEEFRGNGGQVTGEFAGRNLLLLTTTGAKSGRAHLTPLGYSLDGDRLVVSAAAGGAPHHPDWYHNLVANPTVTVELGTETFEARATVSTGAERERLGAERARTNPNFVRNQARTTRQIPLIWLDRSSPPS